MNPPSKDTLFASPLQTTMLLPCFLNQKSQSYVQQFQWTFFENMDRDLFEKSWKRVLKRYDSFYHTFELGEQPCLSIRKVNRLQVEFKYEDWSRVPAAKRRARLADYLKVDLDRGFDPRNDKLCRFFLVRVNSKQSELIWTSHHALFDGRGRLQLIREFIEVHQGFKTNSSVRLQKPPSYQDYLKWISSQSWRASKRFWKSQLSELEETTPLNFGLDHSGARYRRLRQSTRCQFISRRLSRSLKQWSQTNQTSLNILAQAAWGLFLHLSTGNEKVLFGAPRACRKSNIPYAENAVGLFVNTVPVVIKIDPTDTTGEYLRKLKENWLELRKHENTPLPIIHQASTLPKNQPLFESLVGYEKYQLNQLLGSNGRHRFDFNLHGHTEIPFSIQLKDGDRLHLEVAYNNRLYSAKATDLVFTSFIHLLEELTYKNHKIKDIELLSKKDFIRTRDLGTGPKPRIPKATVHQVFEDQVRASPKAVALRFNGKSTSYQRMNQEANRLARYLKHKGIGQGDCVGILLERSELPIIAQLGILKAGACHLPLDPECPEERLRALIADAKPKLILTEKSLRSQLDQSTCAKVDLRLAHKRLQTFSARNLPISGKQDDPAYIMYTSGSTGTPKGVVVPHRAIVRLVMKANYVKLSRKTRCLQMATLAFDASTFEIWAPLLNGGCCVLYPERVPSLNELEAVLRTERIDTLWLTASLFNFVVDTAPEILSGITQLLTGGEALSPPHVRKAQKALPNTRIINGYGPTENTTFSCCYPIPHGQSAKKPVSIGPALSNSSGYVLNNNLKLLPPGCVGELYVGGLGVALGYLKNPEMTKSRFVQNPFTSQTDSLLYKTGDRVFQRTDGRFEFLDRLDDQVKIRGFRIEPLEIQNRLQRLQGIRECAVLVNRNNRNEQELNAFIVLRPGSNLDEATVRRQLESQLPNYMIPSLFHFPASLPLTRNGKIDRKALLRGIKPKSKADKIKKKDLSDTEKTLWSFWSDILKSEPKNNEEDFFNAGGHSLLATHFLHKIQSHFDIPITIHQLYQNANIHLLGQLINRLKKGKLRGNETAFTIKPAKTKKLEPLSIPFRTIVLPEITHPESTPTNHIVRAIELEGDLNPDLLLEALEHALNNHERYRTYAVEVDGEYYERLLPHVTPKVRRNDFSTLTIKNANKRILKIYQRMCQDWVTMREAPMVRVTLCVLPKRRHFFCMSINHSICDGNSLGMLFRETSLAYNALINNQPVTLPKPKYSYCEYEKSLRSWLKAGNEERIRDFWKKRLEGLEPIDFPFLKKNLPDSIQWNDFDHYKVDPQWTKKIKAFTQENHVSTYLFFLSLVKWMNARYTGKLDSYVASSANVRSGESQKTIAGDMISVLLMRNQLDPDRSFLDQLKQDQATLYEAMDNRRIGASTIAKPLRKGGLNIHKMGGQCRVSYAPVLESEFSLQKIKTKAWLRTRVPAMMRFGCVLRECGDDLLVAFQHAPEIYVEHGLDRLKINLQKFLKILLKDPTITLNQLPELTKPSGYKKPATAAEKRNSFLQPVKNLEFPPPEEPINKAV